MPGSCKQNVNRWLWAFLVVLLFGFAYAQPTSELKEFWTRQKELIQTGSYDELSLTYSEDARLFTLAGGEIRTRNAILDFWNESSARAGGTLLWQLVEARQASDNTGSLYGRWELKDSNLPEGYPNWGYFLQLVERKNRKWSVTRAYFWSVGEGHTRVLRPEVAD